MSREIIMVLSDVRSGSTLLDQLLGAHPSILSLGEVHWLAAYVREDRTLYDPVHPLVCTCGRTVRDCSFWQQVSDSLGQPLDSLQLQLKYFNWRGVDGNGGGISRRLRRLPRRFIESFPASFRCSYARRVFGAPGLARDCVALYDAIFDVSGRRFIVDSSKNPFRFRAIHDLQPARIRALLLARDYKAVVHSKMKRGDSLEDAAVGWRRKMTQIDTLTADIPTRRKLCVRYEDLCNDPERELTRICDFLGLDFSPAMLQRPTEDIHHIGGSPSKFDSGRVAISLDTTYQQAFGPEALVKLRRLVRGVGKMWGY